DRVCRLEALTSPPRPRPRSILDRGLGRFSCMGMIRIPMARRLELERRMLNRHVEVFVDAALQVAEHLSVVGATVDDHVSSEDRKVAGDTRRMQIVYLEHAG